MLNVAAWENFAVMIGGASAALTGLLFVSVSLNRDKIVHSSELRASAAQTLVLLIVPLVLCALMLIPDQRRWVLGAELAVFGLLSALVLFRVQHRSELDERSRIADLVDRRETSLLISLLILIGAVTFWVGHGGGLYWIAPAVLLALVTGVINAWLFMVEDVN